MNTSCNLRWHFNVWDGEHCIFDVAYGIGVEYIVFWMVYLILCTGNLIFWGIFHFWGWVVGDLDDIQGIFDGVYICDVYVIWDDYFVFELIYFVFLLVNLVCWATYLIFGNTPVCILYNVFISFMICCLLGWYISGAQLSKAQFCTFSNCIFLHAKVSKGMIKEGWALGKGYWASSST